MKKSTTDRGLEPRERGDLHGLVESCLGLRSHGISSATHVDDGIRVLSGEERRGAAKASSWSQSATRTAGCYGSEEPASRDRLRVVRAGGGWAYLGACASKRRRPCSIAISPPACEIGG